MKKMLSQLILHALIIVIFIIVIPLLLLISLIIITFNGWPVIYAQKRIGKNERVFTLYKFRTMIKGAHKLQSRYSRQNQADGPVFKIYDDPRFTRIGKFLSHTGLDELPQLYNILLGDIAMIGPRPLPVVEAQKLKSWQRKRHTIKPGIISPWVLNGYHSKSFTEWMQSDLEYINHKSLSYDIGIAIRSVWLMIQLMLKETRKLFTR